MAYQDVILADAPVAYYRLNETSGTTATDSSGNGRNGTFTGSTLNQAGLVPAILSGNASVFFNNGGANYLTVPTSVRTALNGAAGITVEAWVKLEALTTFQELFAIPNTGTTLAFEGAFNSTGGMQLFARSISTEGGATDTVTAAAGTFVTGTIYHVVAVVDYANNDLIIYKNGVQVAAKTDCAFDFPALQTQTAASSKIATNITGMAASVVDAWLDEVAIYARVLTPTEVEEHYRAGTTIYVNAPLAELELSGFSPFLLPVLMDLAELEVEGFAPGYMAAVYPDFAELEVDGFTPSAVVRCGTPLAELEVDGFAPARIVWNPPSTVSWRMAYRLTLTGAADGKSDVVLPMASFQSRARSAAKTYIGAVVPYTDENAQAVSDRRNGQMVIEAGPVFANGVEALTEILRVDLDFVETDKGARSRSITLHGYYNATVRPAMTRQLAGVSYTRTGETNMIRASVDIWLRPGDQAVDPETGLSLTADTISYVISPTRQEMTVADRGI